MTLKYNKTTLNKLEHLFKEADFSVRYEKGQFSSGYCLLHDKKIIVINKFFVVRARIESLLDILKNITISIDLLSSKSQELLEKVTDSESIELHVSSH